MATLDVTTTHDFTADSLSKISTIRFVTSSFTVASFSSAQFDDVHIRDALTVIGDANVNQINVSLTPGGTFSSAGWTFSNWTAADILLVFGSNRADTITAPSPQTFIDGNAGADHLIGGDSDDGFLYNAVTDIEAGERINGKGGFGDHLDLNAAGTFDFRHATISHVEQINFGTNATAKFLGSQVGTGLIETVNGAGSAVTVIFQGGSTDLSSVLFFTWTNGEDSITLRGTGNSDVLIGSSQDDILRGGKGKDVLTGAAGNDVFRFDAPLDPTTNVDKLVDYSVGNDIIQLENDVFLGLAGGALDASAFFIGAAAHDISDRIIYNDATGVLIFDSNGKAAGGAAKFARLDPGLGLTEADFFVV